MKKIAWGAVVLSVVACSSAGDFESNDARGSAMGPNPDLPSSSGGFTGSLGDGDGDVGLDAGQGESGNVRDGAVEVPPELSAGGAAPVEEPIATNPFVLVDHDPLSTFAADVDTASYDLFRARTVSGEMVPESSVRLEEFVNYFDYDYPAPEAESETPFAIHLSAAPNLATRETRLLRVGIQGKIVEEKPPANLVFLVDVSGSMSGELPTVQHTLKQTVELLEDDDTVAIVTYASSPGTLLSATPISEKETILAAIDRLTSGGGTNGSGGIVAAYQEAEGAFLENGLNHILMCTDGDFNLGLSGIDQVEALVEEKRKSGITLTALGYGRGNFNDQMMERISNIGNGIYSYIGGEEDAEAYVEERMIQSMIHIAQDMKIQVEFNPEQVHAYRLLGYENRDIADDDFRDDLVDAGEIASGHRVTALYELVLQGENIPEGSKDVPAEGGAPYDGDVEVDDNDLVLVKVRYKTPGAKETDAALEVATSLSPSEVLDGFEATQSDFQFAAAVAAYAEILKKSPYANPSALEAIRVILESQAEIDDDRKEFLALFHAANELRGLDAGR